MSFSAPPFLVVCFLYIFALTLSPADGSAQALETEDLLSFCTQELTKKIGTEAAAQRGEHCTCATEFAQQSTPPSLREPLARIVRREPLDSAQKDALKSEAKNILFYLGLLSTRCPMIVADPLLQDFIKKSLRKKSTTARP